MNSNINKRKIRFFTNRKFLKFIAICIFLCLFFVYFYHVLIKSDKVYTIIQKISETYNYQLRNVEINSIQRVNKFEVNNIVNKHLNQSIFL